MDIILEDYTWLWIWLGLTIFLVVLHFYRNRARKKATIKFANISVLKELGIKTRKKGEIYGLGLRIVVALLICLAGGQLSLVKIVPSASQNMVLAVDSSYSMLSEDYLPNRLEAAIKAMIPFLDKTTEKTNVAILSFGPKVDVIQNFTNNKEELKRAIRKIEVADQPGTAIGDALWVSSKILPKGERGTIIILTDGVNNVGILLDEAIETVKSKGFTIHAAGMSSRNPDFPTPDEESVKRLAAETGGIASISTTEVELESIYDRISGVTLGERVEMKKLPLTSYLLTVGLAILIIGWLLGSTIWDILP